MEDSDGEKKNDVYDEWKIQMEKSFIFAYVAPKLESSKHFKEDVACCDNTSNVLSIPSYGEETLKLQHIH